MGRITIVWQSVSFALGVIAAALIAILVLLISTDVVYRATVGGSIPGLYQTAEMVIGAAVFLGLPIAQQQSGMIGVDVLTSRMSPRVRQGFIVSGTFITLITCLLISWGVLGTIQRAIATNDAVVGLIAVPTWPTRTVILLGMVWLCGELIIRLSRQLKGRELDVGSGAETY